MIGLRFDNAIATLALNDPARRNALSIAMFDALDAVLRDIAARHEVHVVLLRGEGKALCAGFDLGAVKEDPPLMAAFIHRLSALNRVLRRLPQVVVAAAHGAAIAGGCAIVSACDLVVTSREAKLGYPVHRLGVSPAVTIPTLRQMIGAGPARSMLLSGELIDGSTAHKLGLATHLVERNELVLDRAMELARTIASHGPHALRATKRWLNELDGSIDDAAFEAPAEASMQLVKSDEAVQFLRHAWRRS